jgi:hypothetical protein
MVCTVAIRDRTVVCYVHDLAVLDYLSTRKPCGRTSAFFDHNFIKPCIMVHQDAELAQAPQVSNLGHTVKA